MAGEKIRLHIRQATRKDIQAIIDLSIRVYGKDWASEKPMVSAQLEAFPEGQFVVEYNEEIVGHCATFIISGEIALAPHTWDTITGYGFASRHNPHGDYLYGMEVCVDPEYRNQRIGQRLYDARKQLCQEYGLKGIVFAGRLPGLRRRSKKYPTPEAYVEAVQQREIRDPVLHFQIRNDFEIIGILPNYLPDDKESMGYGVHMVWQNPTVQEEFANQTAHGVTKEAVRIASVQLQARKVSSFEEFASHLEYFVDVAADYRCDFVLFPELITMPLVAIEKKNLSPHEAIQKITEYTDQFITTMQEMAVSYNINIIGGTHPARTDDNAIENNAYVFLRNGEVHVQPKIHPTPSEHRWWHIKGGNKLRAIPTDCGPIGVLICYDSEFPETARYLTDQGAKILFVPYCTDERQGHLRVRYCCQARAVENQIYVVTAGIVGNLPDVENMDVHYAESGIYTPCDFPFARDGIAALAEANSEGIIFADLRLDQLTASRNSGTVQNLKDRRFDLYHVKWKG